MARVISLAREAYDLKGRTFPSGAEPATFEALSKLISTVESSAFQDRLLGLDDSNPTASVPIITDPVPTTRLSPASPRSPPPKRHRKGSISIPEVAVGPSGLSSAPRARARPRNFTYNAVASSSSQPIGVAASTSHDARLEGQVPPVTPVLRTVSSFSSVFPGSTGTSPLDPGHGSSTIRPVLKRKKDRPR